MPKLYNILIEVNDSAFVPTGTSPENVQLEGFFVGSYEKESIPLEDYQLSLLEAFNWTLYGDGFGPDDKLLKKVIALIEEDAFGTPIKEAENGTP